MRRSLRHVAFGSFGVSLSLGLAALVLQAVPACGSTDSTAAPDAEVDAPVDTGPPDSATCDLSANLLDKIPDASLADGASTTGLCLGCANAHCGSTIQQCNQSCPCQGAVSSGLTCFLQNPGSPTSCLGSFLTVDSQTQSLGFGLLSCVQTFCDNECQASKLEDAGKEASN